MADIYIAGLGIRSVAQVTRETEHAFRRCREILFVDGGLATAEWLGTLGPEVTPLYSESYAEAGARRMGYRTMAARVVSAALDHPPVAFAMHGHPMVGASAPQLIVAAAEALDLRVDVLPGISALDSLSADLRFDPVANGLQMFEATDMLLRRRPIQTDLPLILWQVGNVESCLHTARPSRPERFERLEAYLRTFYPAEHSATAVFSSQHPLAPAAIETFAIGAFQAAAPHLHAGVTVFIPALGQRPIVDAELLGLLESAEHLRRIAP